MSARIRPLERADLEAASRLLAAEGWTFPPEDLERLLRIGIAVGADEGGRLLGAAFAPLYGPLAWIGNVVVDADRRGTGLGARIVEAALEAARRAGARTIRLHSVHRAESLYARLGFVREGLVRAFRRTRQVEPAKIDALPLDEVSQVAQFDAEAFGADRTPLLALLLAEKANRAFLLRDASGAPRGYAIVKLSDVACEIGPAVARAGDVDAMARLLDAAIGAAPAGSLEIAIPDANAHARRLLVDRGFSEAFTARTMRWGEDARRGRLESILAAGGLEKG